MRLLVAKQANSEQLVYFNQAHISAFGQHQSNPLWTWIECGGAGYTVACPVDEILQQIPQGETL